MIPNTQQLKLEPLNIEGLSYEKNRHIEERLFEILQSWEDTPYCPGQQCRGVAVDCVRFVSAVLDEMLCKDTVMERLPQDASFHNAPLVRQGFRRFLKRYPCTKVEGNIQPGDVLIMGPRNGGPGHAAIVGLKGYWHCFHTGVTMAGLEMPGGGVYCFKEARRGIDRHKWYDLMFGGDNGR